MWRIERRWLNEKDNQRGRIVSNALEHGSIAKGDNNQLCFKVVKRKDSEYS